MTTTTSMPSKAKDAIRIIDSDTHLSEPHDLWTRRAPAKFRDRVPQVKMHNGKLSWVMDGDKVIGEGAQPLSAILKDGTKVPGLSVVNLTIDDVHPGSSKIPERLAYMDEHNIAAQIVYPNLLGFGGQKAAGFDSSLRLVCAQVFNDAMAEFQEQSGDRIFPMAMLPWWDVKEAVAEAKRAAGMGLRGININSDPHTHMNNDGNMLPDLGSPYWNPLWEVCVDNQLPVNFHIGGSEQSMDWFGTQGWPSLMVERHAALGGAMLFFNNGRTLGNLIYSGVCDRFPEIQFVSVESGIGWIPALLQALDYQLGEFDVTKTLRRTPSEYFQHNFYGCFWYERLDISHTIHRVGVDRVLFETDFPHPTCLYPIDDIEQNLVGLSHEEKSKVLHDNAAKLYRIDI